MVSRSASVKLGGSTISTSASRSPLAPFFGATPCPLIRSFLPLEVPGGMWSETVPLGVGTSTLAPATASPSVTGRRTQQVVAPAGKERMWGDADRQHQVACGPTAGRRFALAAKPHLLAVFNARRNLDHDRFRLAGLPLEAQLDLAAADGRAEGDGQFGLGIAPPAFRTATATATAGGPANVRENVPQPAAALPEAFAEELAEVDIFGTEAAARPARSGPPSCTVRGALPHGFEGAAVAVVHFPLFRVVEHIEGGLDFLEFLDSLRIIRVHVRMVLACQLPVGLLDIGRGGVAGDAERFVIVNCHGFAHYSRVCGLLLASRSPAAPTGP